MKIAYALEALRFLSRLAKKQREMIVRKVESYAATGEAGKFKRLQGRHEMSLRAGDYRVLFTVEDDTMFIEKVGDRRDVYQ